MRSASQAAASDIEINQTSVSVLVNISNVADGHSEHGVIGSVQADGPSLIIPVSKRVQVDVHGSSNLGFTVKEVGRSDYQIRPTSDDIKKKENANQRYLLSTAVLFKGYKAFVYG